MVTGRFPLVQEQLARKKNAISIGENITNNAENSVVLGGNSQLTDDASHSVIIGSHSFGTASNAIILGDKSTNNRNNSLSIGSNDNQRQIVNVAAGTENTDAVNVAQLKKRKSKCSKRS